MSSNVTDLIGPVVSLISAGAGAASSFANKPKMPKLETPTAKATPLMPTPDDAASRAAAMKEIARRSSAKGRQSTNMYEKEVLG